MIIILSIHVERLTNDFVSIHNCMPPADILASIILLILTSLPSSTPIHQTILPAQASQVKKFKGHSIPMSLVNSRASSVSSGKLPPSTRKRRYSYVGSDMPPPTNHAFPQ